MRPSVLLTAGVVLSCSASARAAFLTIDLQVSVDGVNWASHADASIGDVVRCRIRIYSDFSLPIHGFAGATLRLAGEGVLPADLVAYAPGTDGGRVPPFNFGAATNTIYRDTPSSFRIDAGSDPGDANAAAGMTFFQRDPATATPGTFMPIETIGVDAFRFNVEIRTPEVRVLAMSMDQLSRGVAAYYSLANSSRPTLTSDVVLDGATVSINVPAPGAAAIVGLAAAAARRRRR